MFDQDLTKPRAILARGLALGLVAALAALLAPAALAAEKPASSRTVVVSASRLDTGLPGTSSTVIEAADIEASTAENLPELLGLEAGIQTRDLFGASAGANAVVDIRGFGATASANVLVLVDGRRLNDIDLAGIDFAAIPLDSIQRIEITRGNAGAVLYGDGAVGGVINIVTKPLARASNSVRGEVAVGSLGVREGSASATRQVGAFTLYGNTSNRHSNGYRENSSLDEKTFTGEVRHSTARGDAFIKIGLDDQSTGLPGARRVTTTSSLVATNPKGAATPFDEASQQGASATVGVTRQIGDNVTLIVDGGVRLKDQEAYIVSAFGPAFNSYLATSLTTWSLTPRAIVDFDLGGMPATGTVGLDYYFSDYDSNRQRSPLTNPIHVYDTRQHSAGLYAQGSLALAPDTDVTAGARVQHVKLRFRDAYDPTA
ncbi:MAG: TonB-dependent receptor, partial [Alphaproteobacteria bacterium]